MDSGELKPFRKPYIVLTLHILMWNNVVLIFGEIEKYFLILKPKQEMVTNPLHFL